MNPLKEYAYIGAIVMLFAGIITVGWYVHRCHADHEVLQSIHAQSVKELAAAKEQIQTDATDHANAIKSQKEISDANLATAALQHASDLDRLRQLDADRAKRAALASAGSASATSAACRSGESEAEQSLKRLERLSAEQADANRDALVAIDTLATERDSLVGK